MKLPESVRFGIVIIVVDSVSKKIHLFQLTLLLL